MFKLAKGAGINVRTDSQIPIVLLAGKTSSAFELT